jgi:hypothetical protein
VQESQRSVVVLAELTLQMVHLVADQVVVLDQVTSELVQMELRVKEIMADQ